MFFCLDDFGCSGTENAENFPPIKLFWFGFWFCIVEVLERRGWGWVWGWDWDWDWDWSWGWGWDWDWDWDWDWIQEAWVFGGFKIELEFEELRNEGFKNEGLLGFIITLVVFVLDFPIELERWVGCEGFDLKLTLFTIWVLLEEFKLICLECLDRGWDCGWGWDWDWE